MELLKESKAEAMVINYIYGLPTKPKSCKKLLLGDNTFSKLLLRMLHKVNPDLRCKPMKIQLKASNFKNCSSTLSHTQTLPYSVFDVPKTSGAGPGLAKTQLLQATLFSKILQKKGRGTWEELRSKMHPSKNYSTRLCWIPSLTLSN